MWNRSLKQLEPVETRRWTWVTLMAVRGGLLAAHLRRLVIRDMRVLESVHKVNWRSIVIVIVVGLLSCERDTTVGYWV